MLINTSGRENSVYLYKKPIIKTNELFKITLSPNKRLFYTSFVYKSDILINMESKSFIFIMRSPDGQEYEIAVPARKEADAERLLKNLLDALNSRDKIVSLKGSQDSAEVKHNHHNIDRVDKSAI